MWQSADCCRLLHFVKKIKESEKQIEEGNYTTYIEEFIKLCK